MAYAQHDYFGHGAPPHENGAKRPRDFKRSILIFGLGMLSWLATYVGMLELIEANTGDLPLVHKLIIGFSVAMLMTMIIWLLDQLFKPHAFSTKVFFAVGYVFLSVISVGFGFGFYWKVLESRGEASRSAESAVGQVQNALHGASTRLEQLQATLTQLTAVSTEKAEIERTKGTSCPNSKPGDGPRRKMREEDAQRFSFASEFVKGRVGAVKTDIAALDGDLAKVVTSDVSTIDLKTGTRNEFLRSLGRKLDLTVTGFNAFRSDPQLRQMRTDLADRAERTTIGEGKTAIQCPDLQLQTALRGVVKAIDQLPELTKPEIAAVEGSEATIEAFRRLTTSFYGILSFKAPPSADELRDLQKKAVQSVESRQVPQIKADASDATGLSKRDYVPLAVALFVDLCLFLVSMTQRPASRLQGLMPKMIAAERGPVIQILSRFNEIHKDRQIRENFEIFRHVVFDMNGDYYVAVPLDAPPGLEQEERELLRVEATLLANLFASFEKEKIFKRSVLPTVSSIRKRLKRQGSKFAESEAFRVYKFTDGAWSDIILGAVMGAARRIEGSRPATIGNSFSVNNPILPVNDLGAGPRVPPSLSLPSDERASPVADFSARAEPQVHTGPVAEDPQHMRRFGPYAKAFRPSPPPFLPAEAAPAIPDAETVPRPADNKTSADLDSNVIWIDRAPPELPKTVDVTLARETATFKLPAGEAMRSESLKSALAKAASSLPVDFDASDDFQLPDLPDLNDETFAPADRALFARMAPPPAE